jgi:hypothetical protein
MALFVQIRQDSSKKDGEKDKKMNEKKIKLISKHVNS